MKTFALAVFIITYIFMIFIPKKRVWAALAAAILFVATGIVGIGELPGTVNFNVLFMLTGMMLTVYYFIKSGMPMKIADLLLKHSRNLRMVTILLSLFAGVVSAFIDNVATVLMIAPVGIAVAKKQKTSPVPMIVSIAVSSNLQGAATLVGDTTSILLGDYAGMNFLDFFFTKGRMGIFWAVELGALITVPVMMFIFRKDTKKAEAADEACVKDTVPAFALCGTILTLIIASFFENRPEMTNGIVCISFGIATMLIDLLRHRKKENLKGCLSEVDHQTLLLLASLFVVVKGIENAGVIDDIAGLFVRFGGNNRFLLYTLIVWGSVAISAFVDNIPYVTAMLPVIKGMSVMMNVDPTILYYGLLVGATLGGNITPVGASANITGVGILRKQGYEVSNKDFMRISVPFTLAAVTTGYLFLLIVWGNTL